MRDNIKESNIYKLKFQNTDEKKIEEIMAKVLHN